MKISKKKFESKIYSDHWKGNDYNSVAIQNKWIEKGYQEGQSIYSKL
jgi:hypothetical protein